MKDKQQQSKDKKLKNNFYLEKVKMNYSTNHLRIYMEFMFLKSSLIPELNEPSEVECITTLPL